MVGAPHIDVEFPSSDGRCVGDLYLPGGSGTAPVVVMAHGIGAHRSFGLRPFAERFVQAGLAVLVFDYRTFGDSPGEPRSLVSPSRHVEDYRAALAFVRSDPRVDGDRVGLWGTSFSGGHVLVVAARDPAVRAVVSQIPFVSGPASTLAYPVRLQVPAILRGVADGLSMLTGRSPVTLPLVAPETAPRSLALLASHDSREGYLSIIPDDFGPPSEVPARITLTLPTYRPIASAGRIGAPTLMVAAEHDSLCPVRATRRAVARIPDCRYVELPIGHFDAYHGEWFETVSSMEAEFLAEHLTAVSR